MQNRSTETPRPAARPARALRAALSFPLVFVALAVALLSQGCGYHVAGHAANLPSEWTTIAIPAFKNDTTRYRIEQRFTEATIREFITRTKYRVVQDTASADAVFHGEVLSIDTDARAVQRDHRRGDHHARHRAHQGLAHRQSHAETVYQDNDMVFRDEYQISTDVNSFFEEQDPALERMSRDLASHIVANVLEGF